jgi:glucokinase
MTQPAPEIDLSLVADIGGTNTRVGLGAGGRVLKGTVRHFTNADFPGIEALLCAFLEIAHAPACAAACVAVAGPVRQGRGRLTNLDWTIDLARLARATGTRRVALLNDLQALGHALGHLAPTSFEPLLRAPTDPEGTMLVIGAGTGFNCAPVHRLAQGRLVPASEAGQVALALSERHEPGLADFLADGTGFVAVESALSGQGLERLHAWSAKSLRDPQGPTAAEVVAAAHRGEPVAEGTMRLFARLLGRVTGDLILTHLPSGGVVLAGGVIRAAAPWLGGPDFAEALRAKGRFTSFVQSFAVDILIDDEAALTGCARFPVPDPNPDG